MRSGAAVLQNLVRMRTSPLRAIHGLERPLPTTSALLASLSGRIFVLVLLNPPDLTPRVSRTRRRRPLRLRVDLPFSFLLTAPVCAIVGVRDADPCVPWALTVCCFGDLVLANVWHCAAVSCPLLVVLASECLSPCRALGDGNVCCFGDLA